jgi:hypothetical protein
MTSTLPLRRTILHFSHIGFTDALTFIALPTSRLLHVANDVFDHHEERRSVAAAPQE